MKTKKHSAGAAPAMIDEAHPCVSPLSWWRTMRAEEFDASTAASFCGCIAGIAMLDRVG